MEYNATVEVTSELYSLGNNLSEDEDISSLARSYLMYKIGKLSSFHFLCLCFSIPAVCFTRIKCKHFDWAIMVQWYRTHLTSKKYSDQILVWPEMTIETIISKPDVREKSAVDNEPTWL